MKETTQNNILNNILLAEFLDMLTTDSEGNIKEDVNSFKFHNDWNWLMLVVDRVESIRIDGRYIDVEMYPDAVLINYQDSDEEPIVNVNKSAEFDGLFETRLQGTYDAVVAFIKWYNENKQQ